MIEPRSKRAARCPDPEPIGCVLGRGPGASDVPRREVLARTLALASIALAIGVGVEARAQAKKIAKAQVRYRDQPNGQQKCGNCQFFVAGQGARGSCQRVEGEISAEGWCTLWRAKA